MFFERTDMIAVHTLTAASHEVLSQLARHRGIESIYDHAKDVIRPEKIKEFRYALRKAQNFFKHAGKDAAEKLEFYYGGTQFLLFDAARLCSYVIGRSIPECNVFLYWFIANFLNSDIGDDPLVKTALQAAQGVDLKNYEVQLTTLTNTECRR